MKAQFLLVTLAQAGAGNQTTPSTLQGPAVSRACPGLCFCFILLLLSENHRSLMTRGYLLSISGFCFKKN